MHFYKNKNILVAGASGFIGTNLIKKLKNLECNIFGTYYQNEPKIIDSSISYIKADLRNQKDCQKILKNIDIVFMCAANSSGAKIMTEKPLDHLTPNLIMNTLMLEAAYLNSVDQFVFISSNTVYPLTNSFVREDESGYEFYDKYHIVAWMKKFSEVMCDMYSNKILNKMNTLVVRPGNLYGPYDKFDWENSKVIAALIRKFIEKQKPIQVWGDGNDIKDFLYIEDFIDGLLQYTALNKFGETVNIASGKSITIREIVSILEKLEFSQNNLKAEIIFDVSKPSMIPVRLIDISKICSAIDWVPLVDIEAGLLKTIEWYKKNNSNDYF